MVQPFVCKVNQFNGSKDRPATTDINGFAPVILVSHNGVLPTNARVISGTVAQRAGLVVGNNYAITVTMTHIDDQYGEQYQYDVIGEVSTMEVVTSKFEQGVVQRLNSTSASDPKSVSAGTPAQKDKF